MLHLKALSKIESQIRDQIVRNENDDRADRKRFLRLLQDEQFELDMEEAIQKVNFIIHSDIIFSPFAFSLEMMKANHSYWNWAERQQHQT